MQQAVFLVMCFAAIVTAYPFYDGATQCSAYTTDFVEGTGPYFSGLIVGSCTEGSVDSTAVPLYINALNMFRTFAGLKSVAHDPSQDTNTQGCALICQANNAIQHAWPQNALCWTQPYNMSCGSSNLAEGSVGFTPADAISGWVNDMDNIDNPNNLGHRLWCLSPTLGGVSMGLTTNIASLYVFGTQAGGPVEYAAWPPPGITPLAAMGTPLLNFIFHYVNANFTSYGTAPTVVSCSIKDSAGTSVGGTCTSQPAGYGPYGAILMPLTTTLVADCYTVSISFKAPGSTQTQSTTYTAGIWDCSQGNGGNSCLATLGPSTTGTTGNTGTGSGSGSGGSGSAAALHNWVELLS